MTGKKMILILAAVAGCASVRPASSRDLAAGHWTGQIDRAGWLQPLSLDIENDDGTYRGEWRAADGIASEPLQKVDVSGDTVRLETDKLLFVGRVQGSKLSGTVSRKGPTSPRGSSRSSTTTWSTIREASRCSAECHEPGPASAFRASETVKDVHDAAEAI